MKQWQDRLRLKLHPLNEDKIAPIDILKAMLKAKLEEEGKGPYIEVTTTKSFFRHYIVTMRASKTPLSPHEPASPEDNTVFKRSFDISNPTDRIDILRRQFPERYMQVMADLRREQQERSR